MWSMSRRRWLGTGLASFGAVLTGLPKSCAMAAFSCGPPEWSYHFDHILGTSLDVWVSASSERAADHAVEIIFAEIERLRRVFSPVDPDSELGRLNQTNSPVSVSRDLIRVLGLYEAWNRITDGACSAQIPGLSRLWHEASRNGLVPDPDMIASLVPFGDRQAWAIDPHRRNVTRMTGLTLDLNSVAKGYIIEQATKMVVDSVPQISGMLLNLGGDLSLWGSSGRRHAHWYLDVQDPQNHAENAKPLTRLALQGGAVATSGGYQRFHTIGGRRYSHLIDPRTGYPAEAITAATVIAPYSTIANILATSLCIPDSRARPSPCRRKSWHCLPAGNRIGRGAAKSRIQPERTSARGAGTERFPDQECRHASQRALAGRISSKCRF